MKSIISHLGTEGFPRVRIGVGEKPKSYELKDYVLGHFSQDEREEMQEGMINAVNAIEKILAGDIDGAMTEYNRKQKESGEVTD